MNYVILGWSLLHVDQGPDVFRLTPHGLDLLHRPEEETAFGNIGLYCGMNTATLLWVVPCC